MPNTTPELGLAIAVDSDDTATYLETNLGGSLTTVDSLFNATTGHTHSGAHQGGPVTTAPPAGSISNAQLGPDVARMNLLVNPGFELWQRGTAFATNTQYTADRWQIAIAGTDAFSVSKDTTHQDAGSNACAFLSFTLGTGAGGTNCAQSLRAVELNLQGKTLSASMRVSTTLANGIRLGLGSDGSGGTTNFSAYHSGGGTYQTLTVTYTVPANALTVVMAAIPSGGTAQAFYIDNATLVVGTQPMNYVPMHPADDMARCLRYYEVLGDAYPHPVIGGYQAAGSTSYTSLPYMARKAVNPTITKNGTWATSNCAQPVSNGGTLAGVIMSVVVTATGYGYCQPSAAGQNITVEGNP